MRKHNLSQYIIEPKYLWVVKENDSKTKPETPKIQQQNKKRLK